MELTDGSGGAGKLMEDGGLKYGGTFKVRTGGVGEVMTGPGFIFIHTVASRN
jgi:hypothetical protein